MIYEKNKTKIIKQNVELNKKLEKSVKAKRYKEKYLALMVY